MKNCSSKHCKQQNPQSLENFGIRKTNKDGLQSQCKSCGIDYNRKNKDRIELYQKQYRLTNKAKIRAAHLLRQYNISLEEYEDLFIKQNGCCKICGISNKNAGNKGLVVDHNHQTRTNSWLVM